MTCHSSPHPTRPSVPAGWNQRIAEITARRSALPDAVWRQRDHDAGIVDDDAGRPIAVLGTSGEARVPAAEFIARAPADIEWLLSALTRLMDRVSAPADAVADRESPSRPDSSSGWDQAAFRCGRCFAVRAAATEDAYLHSVGLHQDAHAAVDLFAPADRDVVIHLFRLLHSAPDLVAEVLALLDQPGGGGR
ncbi:hypothetical protein [Streptomyces vietnamensis]|uniref:hypothetical protein n=1 Tax=Streptomyces vietnamensis TaxID=362257 RepID=UPI000A95BA2A|nr:hypothetical protein [Streptomyces vietnamensis]